jgi:hypothetical protein
VLKITPFVPLTLRGTIREPPYSGLFKKVVAQFIGLIKITNDKAQMTKERQFWHLSIWVLFDIWALIFGFR